MSTTAKDSGKELKEFLEKNLPPLFPRASIKELTNGIISYRTMTNLDFKKMGPPIVRVGRKVCYKREDFITWAVEYFCLNPK